MKANQSRDPGISRIVARPDRRAYGMGLGVILLDDVYPGFPGDVRNPSGYPFPIQYEVCTGIDIQQLVVEKDKSPCLEPILKAAHKLEWMGCRAIVAECGYFAYFQREVAAAVNIPVYMSSSDPGASGANSDWSGESGWNLDGECKLSDGTPPDFRWNPAWLQLCNRWCDGERPLCRVRPPVDRRPAHGSAFSGL